MPQHLTCNTLPQKLSEVEIYQIFRKLHRRQTMAERAQNLTVAEETPCNHSKRDPCRRNLSSALRIRSLSTKRYASAQMQPLSKKRHLDVHNVISCRQNRTCELGMRALSKQLHLRAQNVKYDKHHIENEHRVCNL